MAHAAKKCMNDACEASKRHGRTCEDEWMVTEESGRGRGDRAWLADLHDAEQWDAALLRQAAQHSCGVSSGGYLGGATDPGSRPCRLPLHSGKGPARYMMELVGSDAALARRKSLDDSAL